MQELIARFGGTPALIIKILFLGAVNSLAIWAIPTLLSAQSWVMLAILLLSTIALDFLFLTKRFIPAKYVIIGTILLVSFQIIPIVYNISIAFTNYSTGNVGTKEDAVATIERDSAAESEDSDSYDMVPVYDQTGALVLLLSPQTPIEDTTGTDTVPTDHRSATRPEESRARGVRRGGHGVGARGVRRGGHGVGARGVRRGGHGVGARGVRCGGHGVGARGVRCGGVRLACALVRGPGHGHRGGGHVPADLRRDRGGPGGAAVLGGPVRRVRPGHRGRRLRDGPGGGPAVDRRRARRLHGAGPGRRRHHAPGLLDGHRAPADPRVRPGRPSTFTSLETGTVYVDNGEGNFANPQNPEDYLVPGWREFVGLRTSRAS